MLYFSAKTLGIYDTNFHGGNIPDDAVAITAEERVTLLAGEQAGKIITADDAGRPTLRDRPTTSAAALCALIDTAADTARRVVAGDPLRAVEYERAATEAQAFKDAGYPDGAVPRSVAAWAIGGRTAKQAANSVIAEAAAYIEVLYRLREIRLSAKEAVRGHMVNDDMDNAQRITDEAIQQIHALVVGVGNAGG